MNNTSDKNLIVGLLNEIKQLEFENEQLKKPGEEIAIIGMACRFPGGANSIEQFWQLLQQGYDGISEVPSSRWDINQYYDPDPESPGKMSTRKGGFLDIDVSQFDAGFFNISPKEAQLMDPQQRLLLEVTWEALENAGMDPKILKGSQTGVYIGLSTNDYTLLQTKYQNETDITAYRGTGNSASVAAGRIAYTLGTEGPAISIDTACSSSLVAVHYACQGLLIGESNCAIVGGVNLILAPDNTINFSKAHMLSGDGYCKTFDASADGYVRGEGCGVIILKTLSNAMRDGDPILALIKGSAVNQDGASGGLTVPNGSAQAAVILKALQQAQLKSDDIDYVEVHGTGTKLGDPIEIRAIGEVLGQRKRPLLLSSVKTNIGHLEAAAGIAGLIKTVLSLQHQLIPAHQHLTNLNPLIDLKSILAEVPLRNTAWPKCDKPRHAGISSFGFSGTNAHIILEEAPINHSPKKQALSATQFNRQRYWLEIRRISKTFATESGHVFLGRKIDSENIPGLLFETDLSVASQPLLNDHVFYDVPVFAFAAYLSTVLEAAATLGAKRANIQQITVEIPLLFKPNEIRTLQTYLDDKNPKGLVKFEVLSRNVEDTEWTHHCQGRLSFDMTQSRSIIDYAALKAQAQDAIDRTNLFDSLIKNNVVLGAGFQWIDTAFRGEDYVLASLVRPAGDYFGEAVRHSGMIDAGFMLGASRCLNKEVNQVFVPIQIEGYQVSLINQEIAWVLVKLLSVEEEQHACSISWLDNNGAIIDHISHIQFRYAPQAKLLQSLNTKPGINNVCTQIAWQTFEPKFSDEERQAITLEMTTASMAEIINLPTVTPLKLVLDIRHITFSTEVGATEVGVIQQAMRVAQGLLVLASNTEIELIIKTQNGLNFKGGSGAPLQSAVIALFKCLTEEQPRIHCIFIDGENEQSIIVGNETLIVYHDNQWYCGRLQIQAIPQTSKNIILDRNASYLITGGLGGLGKILIEWLFAHGARHIWCVGRSAPVTKAHEGITVRTLDIADKNAVIGLLDEIKQTQHPLKGIFHLAGVLDDGMIVNQTPEKISNVWLGKVLGAWNLHQITELFNSDLDYFILFSSISTLFGSPGQSNYAAANGFLDGLAQLRHARNQKALSVQWGAWAGNGMAAGVEDHMRKMGIEPMDKIIGLQLLEQVLQTDIPIQGAFSVHWQRMAKNRLDIPAWLSNVLQPALEAKGWLVQELEQISLEEREAHLQTAISNILKQVLGLSVETFVNPQEGFFNLGMDSLMAVALNNRVQHALGSNYKIMAAEIFNYPTVITLSEYLGQLIGLTGLKQTVVVSQENHKDREVNEPIAIIGMSCRYPGGANSPNQYWQKLVEGFDAIVEVPKSRWDNAAFYDPDPAALGKTRTRTAGFLDIDVSLFDADFFKISPKQATMTDPQQRLLLEVTWEAIEDAGIAANDLRGTETGVYVGIWHSDYADLMAKNLSTDGINQYTNATTLSATAGIIAYHFGLMGPAYAVDTACSSSLVALDGAVKALRNHECEQAIVGGSNLMLVPDITIGFDKAGMLSTQGHCKTFDASADGYVRAEGIGIILVKRLSDALRDGNRIYAVIKSSRVNHNGPASGITVPNGVAQANLIKHALFDAGISSEEVDYIEAHGTGTALGDPIEMSAIQSVFESDQRKSNPLIVGSVKTNIGHLEATAGIASLMKVVLSLKHNAIPPNLHFKNENPKMNMATIPAIVPTRLMAWEKKLTPRIAGVSSFGATGVNAHVIVEEAPEIVKIKQDEAIQKIKLKPSYLLALSAKNQESLIQKVRDLCQWLIQQPKVQAHSRALLPMISYTLNAGRNHHNHRLALVVDSLDTLEQTLLTLLANKPGANIFQGIVDTKKIEDEAIFRKVLKITLEELTQSNNSDEKSYKENINSLANLYTKGLNIDWELLYQSEEKIKISLPTYPFLRERYWIFSSNDSLITSEFTSENKNFVLRENNDSVETLSLKILAEVHSMVSQLLGMSAEKLNDEELFRDYGFDSLLFTNLALHIQKKWDIQVTPTHYYTYPTLKSFSEHLVQEYRDLLIKSESSDVTETLNYPFNGMSQQNLVSNQAIETSYTLPWID